MYMYLLFQTKDHFRLMRPMLPKMYHTYLAMMKLLTVIPYLKKI